MAFASDHVLQLLNLDTFPTDIDEKFLDNFIELYLPIGMFFTKNCKHQKW